MDPLTTAIVGALSAGAVGGLTETSKMAITDAYTTLKDLLARRFGAKSKAMQAIEDLEARPSSAASREILQHEIGTRQAEQDQELLAAAGRVMTLIQPQQAGFGKITIQNNAQVQGQNIGDYQQITQYFGASPKAQG